MGRSYVSPVERDSLVQLIVDGSWTIAEVAELMDVGVSTVKLWLNHREKGLASKIARREKDKFLDAQMTPVLEWMEEHEVHNMTQASLRFQVSYQKFSAWVKSDPERKKRVDAIHQKYWDRRREEEDPQVPPMPKPPTDEELALMRMSVKELEAKRDEHAAELDRLLGELRQAVKKARTGS